MPISEANHSADQFNPLINDKTQYDNILDVLEAPVVRNEYANANMDANVDEPSVSLNFDDYLNNGKPQIQIDKIASELEVNMQIQQFDMIIEPKNTIDEEIKKVMEAEANKKRLTTKERDQLYAYNPNAVIVYLARIEELEKIIEVCNVEIEWIKTERAWDSLDNEGNAANIKQAQKMEAVMKKRKQAEKDLESACKHYRSLIPKTVN